MKKIFIILFLFLNVSLLSAQIKRTINQTQRVQIKITYDRDIVGIDSLSLSYLDHSWGTLKGAKLNLAKASGSDSFYFDLKNNEKIAYFSFYKPSKATPYINFISDFISEPGDDIVINIVKDLTVFNGYGLQFSGRGSAKYQCQYELTKTLPVVAKKFYKQPHYNIKNRTIIPDSMYYNYFPIKLMSEIDANTETFKENLVILERYKNRLGEFMYNVLKTQIYGELEDSNMGRIIHPYTQFKDRTNFPENFNLIENKLLSVYQNRYKISFQDIPTQYLSLSKNFINYTIKVAADTIFDKKSHYNYLKNNFKGLLRDRLLAAYFSRYFFEKKGADIEVADALTFVKTDYCRSILQSFNTSLRPGNLAYNFELPDSSGKTIKMSDLKGKVVLLDFWFTGCSGCRTLTEQMRPIVKQFENNNKVVFVSINIDKDILKWKESIRSGKYTHENSIDLSTHTYNGRKIIDHYRLFGYPTIIIIDKGGKIVTGSPPEPNNPSAARALIDLLQKSIDKD